MAAPVDFTQVPLQQVIEIDGATLRDLLDELEAARERHPDGTRDGSIYKLRLSVLVDNDGHTLGAVKVNESTWSPHRPVVSRYLGEPRLNVLHTRDPDSECVVQVFIADTPVKPYIEEDVDPGRGAEREDWDERLAEFATDHTNFGRAVWEALDSASGSEHIL